MDPLDDVHAVLLDRVLKCVVSDLSIAIFVQNTRISMYPSIAVALMVREVQPSDQFSCSHLAISKCRLVKAVVASRCVEHFWLQ